MHPDELMALRERVLAIRKTAINLIRENPSQARSLVELAVRLNEIASNCARWAEDNRKVN